MIGVALIGLGYWGSKLQRYIEESKDFNLLWACDSRTNLEPLWTDKRVNSVVVATRNDSHYFLVNSALEHKKNVLVEKPLALTALECEDLRELARKNKKVLMVEYTYTFSKALQKAQELANGIGELVGFEMVVRHLGRFYGGSVYWLLGSHMLSILDMFVPLETLSDSFERVNLVDANGNVETGMLIFKKEKLAGQITVSLNYPGKETKVIIYGENGTIVYDPLSRPSLWVERYKRLKWVVGSELPRERGEFDFDESHNLRYALQYFGRVLCGEAPSNIETAVNITRILEGLQNNAAGS